MKQRMQSRQKPEAQRENFWKRNWKIAVGAIGATAAAAAIAVAVMAMPVRNAQAPQDIVRDYTLQCYDRIYHAIQTGSDVSNCAPIYAEMLQRISKDLPELNLNPLNQEQSFETLENYFLGEGFAFRSVRIVRFRDETMQLELDRIVDEAETQTKDKIPVKLVTLGDSIVAGYLAEMSKKAETQIYEAGYTEGNTIFLRPTKWAEDQARSLWSKYESAKPMRGLDFVKEAIKYVVANQVKDPNAYLQLTYKLLMLAEMQDIYDASKNQQDFVDRYLAAVTEMTITHEEEHIRDRVVRGKDEFSSNAELRAGLAELLRTDYNPESQLDGHGAVAFFVSWLLTNSAYHIDAGAVAVECFLNAIRNNPPANIDTSGLDATNPDHFGLYMLKIPELTGPQLRSIGQACYDAHLAEHEPPTEEHVAGESPAR